MEFLEIIIVFLFCVLSFLIGSKYYNQNQEAGKKELQTVSSTKSQYRQVLKSKKLNSSQQQRNNSTFLKFDFLATE